MKTIEQLAAEAKAFESKSETNMWEAAARYHQAVDVQKCAPGEFAKLVGKGKEHVRVMRKLGNPEFVRTDGRTFWDEHHFVSGGDDKSHFTQPGGEDLTTTLSTLTPESKAAIAAEVLADPDLYDLNYAELSQAVERRHETLAVRAGLVEPGEYVAPVRVPVRDEVVATPDPVKSDPSDEVLDRYNRGCSELTQALSQMRQHGISVYALETSAATIDELVDRGHRTREAILDIQTELLKHEDKKARK